MGSGATMIFGKDGKPGLRIESAASVTIRDSIANHLTVFRHVIVSDRAAGQSTAAAYIDGLAGCLSLVIAGGNDRTEVVETAIKTLREAIERDLRHLGRKA